MTEADGERGVGLPGTISQMLIVAKYELLNLRRSRRFNLVLAMVISTSAVLTVVVGYYRPHSFLSSPLAFYGNWSGLSMLLILTFVGVFLGGDSISSEFQSRTGYSMIGNPMSRAALYAGKFLAAFTASVLALLAFEIIEGANGLFYFGGRVPIQFFISSGLSIVAMLSILGIAFFLSSLLKNGSLSMLIETILLLLVFNLMAQVIEGLTRTQPWYDLSYALQLLSAVLTPSWMSLASPSVFEGLAVMIGYFVACGIAGLVIFQRSELA